MSAKVRRFINLNKEIPFQPDVEIRICVIDKLNNKKPVFYFKLSDNQYVTEWADYGISINSEDCSYNQ